jgi:hypothetical protein
MKEASEAAVADNADSDGTIVLYGLWPRLRFGSLHATRSAGHAIAMFCV